jgi:hypothetical protein
MVQVRLSHTIPIPMNTIPVVVWVDTVPIYLWYYTTPCGAKKPYGVYFFTVFFYCCFFIISQFKGQ